MEKQHENPAQAKFCLECGARSTLACAKCQSELSPSAKFCPECGEIRRERFARAQVQRGWIALSAL
jgi:ribosomal protein L40E